jgi:hypothetical protein
MLAWNVALEYMAKVVVVSLLPFQSDPGGKVPRCAGCGSYGTRGREWAAPAQPTHNKVGASAATNSLARCRSLCIESAPFSCITGPAGY